MSASSTSALVSIVSPVILSNRDLSTLHILQLILPTELKHHILSLAVLSLSQRERLALCLVWRDFAAPSAAIYSIVKLGPSNIEPFIAFLKSNRSVGNYVSTLHVRGNGPFKELLPLCSTVDHLFIKLELEEENGQTIDPRNDLPEILAHVNPITYAIHPAEDFHLMAALTGSLLYGKNRTAVVDAPPLC